MPSTENKRGLFAVMVAHCAGMLDLVALPVWVGTLVSRYAFDPQQAGGLATLFLIGASVASMVLAPRFNRHNAKWMAVAGFGVAALAFMLASQNVDFTLLAGLHLLGGMATGTALSFTHGTIGRAMNPHRVFAWASLAVGIFGILFLGTTPGLVERYGGAALFFVFTGTMTVAALACLFFFPRPQTPTEHTHAGEGQSLQPLSRAVWFCIVGIALMCTTQAMTLSFFERIGMARGFGRESVTMALVMYGLVALVPGALAGMLEKRLSATTVICTLPVFQAVFAMTATHTSSFPLYAVSGALMAFTIIFTHTFAFGLMARLDRTGRAVAATPAMLMVGAAIGPFIGGTLYKFIGMEAIGYAATVLVALEMFLFNQTRKLIRGNVGGVCTSPERA